MKNVHLSIMSRNPHYLEKRTAHRSSGECEIDYLIRIRLPSVALRKNLGCGIPKVNKLSLQGRDYHLLTCLGRSLCRDCCLEGKSFSRTCRGNLSSCPNDSGILMIKSLT